MHKISSPNEADQQELKDRLLRLTKAQRACLARSLQINRPRLNRPTRRPNPDDPIPLSFAQERLWFVDQLNSGSTAYNIMTAWSFDGELRLGVLERSLNEVVRRHESLRTTFTVSSSTPNQIIHAPTRQRLPVIDLRNRSLDEQHVEIGRLERCEANQVFDLRKGPLWRATLLRLADDRHRLYIAMHHIISDGWSVGVFEREVRTLYDHFAHGRASPLAELPIQYADFATWQRSVSEEKMAAHLEFWSNSLAGAPLTLNLPTDHPYPQIDSNAGAWINIVISSEVTDKLRDLAMTENATIFMALLACYHAWLYLITGDNDLTVGIPIANRNHSETEGLIGFFVNALPIRVQLDDSTTFRNLLHQLRLTTLEAYAHQDLPFEQLVQKLRPNRSLQRHPVFQASFALQNTPGADAPRAANATLEEILRQQAPFLDPIKFDISLHMRETQEGMVGAFGYRTDLFEYDTARNLIAQLHQLARAAATAPDTPLTLLPLLDAVECDEMLARFSAFMAPLPAKTFSSYINEVWKTQAGALAVIGQSFRLTWSELSFRVNLAARQIAAHCEAGALAVCGTTEIDGLVVALGALVAGVPLVVLDSLLPIERLREIVAAAKIRFCYWKEELLPQLEKLGLTQLPQGITPNGAPHKVLSQSMTALIHISYDDDGCIQHCKFTHAELIAWLVSMIDRLELEPSTVGCAILPDPLDSFMATLCPLVCGGVVVLPGAVPLGTRQLAGRLEWDEVSLLFTTPELAARLGAEGWPFDGDAVLVLSDGHLDAACYDRLCALGTAVWRQTSVMYPLPGGLLRRSSTASSGGGGRAVLPYALGAFNGDQPAPLGSRGELRFRIFHGERRDVETSWQSTKYQGRCLRNGEIELVGVGNRGVIEGRTLDVQRVRRALLSHEQVFDAMVDIDWAKSPFCEQVSISAVVLSSNAGLSEGELQQWLTRVLPPWEIPTHISLQIGDGSSHLDCRVTVHTEQTDEAEAVAELRTPLEEVLIDIWVELLGHTRFGVKDNFFELGGHSLLAAQLVARIREILGIDIELRRLFEASSIITLATTIREDQQGAKAEQSASWLIKVATMTDDEVELALKEYGR